MWMGRCGWEGDGKVWMGVDVKVWMGGGREGVDGKVWMGE